MYLQDITEYQRPDANSGDLTAMASLARTDPDINVLDSVLFMSMCPNCKDVRSQRGFSSRSLLRLLERRLPIEAYCVVCDDFWPISAPERDALARELAR